MSLRLLVPALLAAALAAGPAAAQAPLPPAADFFAAPSFSAIALSPDGGYLAARFADGTRRDALVVVDLATSKAKAVARFNDVDVGHVQWINDDALLFDTVDRQQAYGDRRFAPGLFTVSRDGKDFRQLAERTGPRLVRMSAGGNPRALPWNTYMMDQPGAQDSSFVYVRDAHFTGITYRFEDLLRLDTSNGNATTIVRPGEVRSWLLDNTGAPRLAAGLDKGQRVFWLRDTATGAWRELTRSDAYVRRPGSYTPTGFGPDGTLYAIATLNGDFSALYTVDLATGALAPKPRVRLEGYDFRGYPVQNADQLLGVRYLGATWGTEWFDAGMKAVQADVDAALPATVNTITVPRRSNAQNVLVRAFSDRQPAVHYVYNKATHQLLHVGDSNERIVPAQMGRQKTVTYPARDGLNIPALLTLPPGTEQPAKQPMVVLVHDGPWTRGAIWGWHAEAQFLASRGYAVLQPDFRGSTGYGSRHFMAGLKEWGGRMQDDVADGARWAIAQGYADAGRICIAGEGYGGYSALMGLARDGDLFRCGVARAAFTDLVLMQGGSWLHRDVLPEDYRDYGLPQLMGDAEQDAAKLQAASPLAQAARIRQPVLLAYSGKDLVVPLVHGTRLRKALQPHNPNVEWVEYDAESHGWTLRANQVDFWTRVEKFLARQLAPGAAKQE